MVKRDKVTSVISQQVKSYLEYLEKRQIALNILISNNSKKYLQSQTPDRFSFFRPELGDAHKASYKSNKLLLYKIQFLIDLLKFSFYGIRSDEIEDAQCYIKDLYEMLEQSDPRGSFFIIDPISDKDYRFDNIHVDSLGLDSWFGPDSVVFEEKPACILM